MLTGGNIVVVAAGKLDAVVGASFVCAACLRRAHDAVFISPESPAWSRHTTDTMLPPIKYPMRSPNRASSSCRRDPLAISALIALGLLAACARRSPWATKPQTVGVDPHGIQGAPRNRFSAEQMALGGRPFTSHNVCLPLRMGR